MDTSTLISTLCHINIHTYIPPPYVPNQMWGMPSYPFGVTQYPAWGAPQTSVLDRLTPPVQDRLRAPQFGPRAQTQQDCQTTRPQRLTNPAGGHTSTTSNSTIKGDIIKIGTTDVIVQQNNEGSMIFGESTNTNKKKKVRLSTKQPIQNTPCLMVPIGIDTIIKAKITAPQSKGESSKGGGKNIQ
jgi:hypothetical protein